MSLFQIQPFNTISSFLFFSSMSVAMLLGKPIWAQKEAPLIFQDAKTNLKGLMSSDSSEKLTLPIYNEIIPFMDNPVTKAVIEGQYVLIDWKGKVLGNKRYAYLGWSNDLPGVPEVFSTGVIGFQMDEGGKWGLLNEKGKTVMPPTYDHLQSFDHGISVVGNRKGEGLNDFRWGGINTSGNIIIPVNYDLLDVNLDRGAVLVCKSTKNSSLYGLLNYAGEEVLPTDFPEIKRLGFERLGVRHQNGLMGLHDVSGKEILPPQYVDIGAFSRGRATVNKYYRFGMIGVDGKLIIPCHQRKIEKRFPVYKAFPFPQVTLVNQKGKEISKLYLDDMQNVGSGLFLYRLEEKFGLMRGESGEDVFFDRYDSLLAIKANRVIVQKGNYQGVIDRQGKIIIPLHHNDLTFDDYGWIRSDSAGIANLYDYSGNNATKSHYQYIGEFCGGQVRVKAKGTWGYLDSTLTVSIPLKYENVSDFNEGYAAVKQKGLYGVIDEKGGAVISHVLDSLIIVNQHYFIYLDNKGWGIVSPEGIEGYQGELSTFQLLKDGCTRVHLDKKSGLLNRFGKLSLPPIYDVIYPTSQKGLYATIQDQRRGFMNTDMNVLPKLEAFEEVAVLKNMGDQLIPIKLNGKYGFVDYMGRIRIANRYDSVTYFSNGLAPFKIKTKWGFVNDKDEIAIQPLYDKVYDFHEGYALVKEGGKYGLLDARGKIVLPLEYDKLSLSEFGNWISLKDGKYGLVTAQAREVIYPQYESVEDLGNGHAITKKKGKYGFDAFTGEKIIFPEYDKVVYNQYDGTFLLYKYLPVMIVD